MNQQFGNMAGMGRGMPNMNMMQNVGMQMPMNGMNGMNGMNAMGNMNPQMAQQKPPNFLHLIYQTLNQNNTTDGPFTGWQANVQHQERAAQIKILFDSLRVLTQTSDSRRSLEIAIAFERKQFIQSPSLEAYKQSIHEKLAGIRDQRQQNISAGANGGMVNQVAAGLGPNMAQMPGMNPNMATFPQQNGQGNMGQNSMQNPAMMNPNLAMNQMQQQNPMAQQPRPPELSAEDNKWINSRAAEMATGTSRERMQEIVGDMDPRVRQSLQEKQIDPIIYHFRMKATKEFRMQQAQRNGQALMGMGMQPNPSQSPFQAAGIPNVQQAGDASFMNSIDYTRLQQEGLRQQEEGQVVVPASNPTPDVTNNQMLRQRRDDFARVYRQRNPAAPESMVMQMANNHIHQWRASILKNGQAQQAQMGQNMMGGQKPMQQQGPGGVPGMNQNVNPGMPNASPAQNIAQPQQPQQQTVGQPQQAQQQLQAQAQAQGAGQAGQQRGQPPTIQYLLASFQQMPPQLQNLLRSRPQQEWPTLFTHFRARMQAQQRAKDQQNAQQIPQQQQAQNALQQQQMAMQRSASQQTKMQQNPMMAQMTNQAQGGNAAMQPSLSNGAENVSGMPGLTPAQIQQQQNIARAQESQRLAMAQRAQQMQQQQQSNTQPQGQMGQQWQQGQNPDLQQLIEMVSKECDHLPAPQQFVTLFTQAYLSVGVSIPPLKTWANFKMFTQKQANPRVTMKVIISQQVAHHKKMRQQMQNAQNQQQLQGQVGQMGAQGPNMMAQNSMAAMQSGRPAVTNTQVAEAKANNPQWASLSDEQVLSLIQSRNQNRSNAAQAGSGQQGQANAKAASAAQRPNVPNNQKQQQPQSAAQGQATSNPVQPTKGLKRPNDDTVQQNQKPSPAAPQVDAAPANKAMTKEQQEQNQQARQRAVATIKQIQQELQKDLKNTPPQQMDAAARQRVVVKLSDQKTKSMLQRFNEFVLNYVLQEPNSLDIVKTSMRHHWHLMQQYKDKKAFVLADQFSLTAENIDQMLGLITRLVQRVVSRQAQLRNAANQAAMPLTRENLDMVEKQGTDSQPKAKNQKRDAPPPAPVTEKAPFAFPPQADRGHGAPIYAEQGVKIDGLRLPPNKKIKSGTGGTPDPPELAGSRKSAIRCPVPTCNTQPQGFATQDELEAHRLAAHAGPVNYLEALDGALQGAFNLDNNFEQKPSSKSMEKTLSGINKFESKPGTPVNMIRTASQVNRKSAAQSKPIKQDYELSDSWNDVKFPFDSVVDVFGANEAGDMIPTAQDSSSLLERTLAAYSTTEDYKRIFGDDTIPSENTSTKSKSPDQGSEPSLPSKDNSQFGMIDFTIDGTKLPALEGDFDILTMDNDKEWTMLDKDSSLSPWENVDNTRTVQVEEDPYAWIHEPMLDDGINHMQHAELMQMIQDINP